MIGKPATTSVQVVHILTVGVAATPATFRSGKRLKPAAAADPMRALRAS
jgi:hypothetical protein